MSSQVSVKKKSNKEFYIKVGVGLILLIIALGSVFYIIYYNLPLSNVMANMLGYVLGGFVGVGSAVLTSALTEGRDIIRYEQPASYKAKIVIEAEEK